MAITVEQFAARMQRAAVAVKQAPPLAVAAGAAVLVSSVLVAEAADTGGSLRLRGVGRSGARIGAKAVPLGAAEALITGVGPVHLLNNPTKRHAVKPRRARALSTPLGPRASAVVAGTPGKRTFEKGIAAGLPGAREVVAAAATGMVRAALG